MTAERPKGVVLPDDLSDHAGRSGKFPCGGCFRGVGVDGDSCRPKVEVFRPKFGYRTREDYRANVVIATSGRDPPAGSGNLSASII